uniref:DUF2281 domain-containing protein n=1 Tax=Desulfatirhabdium butyrativorans TaxID=340467 RepID=A0A7C4RQM1_9BACT
MAVVERIQLYLQQLPPFFQTEVLDFVEYLLTKAEREERAEWSNLSLAHALHGMEDEEMPIYTIADLKVIFA